MNPRILFSAAAAAVFCGVLPAKAADPQMLSLVMPNAQVLAGVNVQQAFSTPFGQYVVSLIAPQDQSLQTLAQMTGLNPTTDVTELLVASTGAPAHTGLAMARGTFDTAKILAAATLKGAVTETYGGLTILEPAPKTSTSAGAAGATSGATTAATATETPGLVFFDGTLAVMGDVASVKAAIDRRSSPTTLPASLVSQVAQWSGSEDAWVVDTAPLSSLKLPNNSPSLPGGAQIAALQTVLGADTGVKFGSNVTISAQVQTDTAQDAQALAGLLQFAANLMQAQANTQDAAAAALLKSMTVSSKRRDDERLDERAGNADRADDAAKRIVAGAAAAGAEDVAYFSGISKKNRALPAAGLGQATQIDGRTGLEIRLEIEEAAGGLAGGIILAVKAWPSISHISSGFFLLFMTAVPAGGPCRSSRAGGRRTRTSLPRPACNPRRALRAPCTAPEVGWRRWSAVESLWITTSTGRTPY